MKQIATEAIILKRLNYGEADRILTILTPTQGKVGLLAKGVRRTKSKLAGGLELFSLTDINYIDGKGELKTVVSTRLKKYFKNIVSNVDRTYIGYDFMKIIDSFTQHSEETEYYSSLALGLESLNNLSLPVSTVEVWFYTTVLNINGSGINLEKPIGQLKFSDDNLYDFSYEDMSFVESSSGQFTPKHIKFLRLVMRSSKPEQLVSVVGFDELSADLLGVVKQSATMHKA